MMDKLMKILVDIDANIDGHRKIIEFKAAKKISTQRFCEDITELNPYKHLTRSRSLDFINNGY